jgi:hypothetical protein
MTKMSHQTKETLDEGHNEIQLCCCTTYLPPYLSINRSINCHPFITSKTHFSTCFLTLLLSSLTLNTPQVPPIAIIMVATTDFTSMKVTELIKECTARGLNKIGKKVVLIERLTDYEQNNATPAEGEEEEPAAPTATSASTTTTSSSSAPPDSTSSSSMKEDDSSSSSPSATVKDKPQVTTSSSSSSTLVIGTLAIDGSSSSTADDSRRSSRSRVKRKHYAEEEEETINDDGTSISYSC